ncbi:Uncharacterized protein M6B38_233540 [Iris pallida]|uniref:SAP domain-containing protein n=1 Tax=Iris pallida TaxID=29817 RepID=A0AAX6DQP4_IRIPA|nr:Uncharacterized protein M6B38_233540 [Iris pallida]
MDYQGNLEMYLNLSRKDLQGLCKSNHLPGNRSKTELAESLASFFKKNNVHPAPSKERLNSPMELSFSKSFVQDTKSKETSEMNNKGEYEERKNIGDSDNHKVAPCMEGNGGEGRQHSTSGKQMEIIGHMDGQAVENAYNIVVNAVCSNTKSPHVFSLTTSGDGNGCPVTDGQLNSNCDTDRPNSELCELPELIKHGQKLLNYAVPSSKVHKLASVRNSQPRAADCYPEGRSLSPKRNVTKATPSFKFFVASDEGIDLHVDLNSNPLEWIRGLRDGVSETLDPRPHKSVILPNHTDELVSVNGCLKISQLGNIGINLQSNGERNSGCTTSTMSSVSEIYQSEGCQPDATVVSSESSVLTSVSPPVEMSGGLDGNRANSSYCAAHSNVQKSITNTIACPGNANALPQNMVDASLKMDKCNTLLLATSVKPIDNVGILSLEETRKPKELECTILSNAVDGSYNVEAIFSHAFASSLLENKLLKHGETEKHILTSGNLENDNAACPVSGETEPNDGSFEVAGSLRRSPSASELGGQLLLGCSVTEAQSDAGSADDLLTLHACIHGSPIMMDPVATLKDGLVKRTPVKEMKNSSDRNPKRSHSPEVNEEIQHKRHQHEDEINSGMVVNLRTARTSAKDTISDEVLRPRRSTRLHPKVFSNFPLIDFILWFLVYIRTKRMYYCICYLMLINIKS